jgi:HK97 family phage major capsid protein
MSANKKKLEEVLELVKKSNEEVELLKKSGKDNSEKLESLVSDLFEKRKKAMDEDLISRFRKGEHLEPREGDVDSQSIIINKSADPKVRQLQEFNDDVYIVSKMLRCRPEQTKIWKKNQTAAGELRKAINVTTSTQGANWVPTELSADVVDKFRLALKVGALFKRIQMPTNPYDVPIAGSDASAYLVPESTSDTATKITASQPSTNKLRLSAQKLAARTIFSEESSEDMITPVLPWLKDNLATVMAQSFENALINGDFTSVVHMDADSDVSSNVRKAYNGLRRQAKTGAVTQSVSSFSTASVRTIRTAMGKYGVDPRQLAWIVSPKGYQKMVGLAEVQTVDKYGPAATILSGELAKFDGIPILVSEHVREDLNATGYYDSTTTDNSVIILVWLPGFWIGDRRMMTLKTFEDIQVDQTVLVTTMRAAFDSPHDEAVEKIVNIGYDLAM